MEYVAFAACVACVFGGDYVRCNGLVGICNMSLPFLGLSPFMPRVVDVPYAATTLTCAVDCTDCSDLSDQTDQTDITDVTDQEDVI